MTAINEFNAYAYSDNYAVLDSSGFCVGCEHNQQEADTLRRYLDNKRGGGFSVRKNSIEQVRAAKAFRPTPVRYEFREDAFRELGLWS